MTEKELNQLYFLNRETERLIMDLDGIKHKGLYHSPILSDMPKGGKRKDIGDYVAEKNDLEKIISLNLQKIQIERSRLERYIGNINDAEVRLIFRLRHINGMTWEQIGLETNMFRTTVVRKYRQFMKSCTQCT